MRRRPGISGYGDFAIRPDLATLRRIPWLDGTALVLGDVVDHHGALLAEVVRLAGERMARATIASQLDIGEATVYRILAHNKN